MVHQSFQEAIEQFSKDEELNSEEIKNKFNLKEEDMQAMNAGTLQGATKPNPGYCCSCC